MKFIELFAGIGGFRYGLEKVRRRKQKDTQNNRTFGDPMCKGVKKQFKDRVLQRPQFNCVWANDNDKYACQVYRKNFGKKELYEGDIRKVKPKSIPSHDLITAGFPCQSFSIAGKRGGFEDSRGTLFYEICRIAKFHRTPYLFLENVKGLLNHDEGRTFSVILKSLSELGYDCQWQVFNSKDFGVPQNRERVFIIGHLRGLRRPEVFPLGESNKRTLEGAANIPSVRTITGGGHSGGHHSGMTIIKEINPDNSYAVTSSYSKGKYGKGRGTLIQIGVLGKDSEATRVYNIKGIARTIKGGGGMGARTGLYETDNQIRRLTPTECERLQGFPDGWTSGVSDTQRYKCLGNAVATNVITEIGKRLLTNDKT